MRMLTGLLLMLALALPVAWADRMFPLETRVGVMRSNDFPRIVIDERVFVMGPGVKIYDQENRMLPYTDLPEGPELVAYQLGPAGEVSRIWLLTASEKASMREP